LGRGEWLDLFEPLPWPPRPKIRPPAVRPGRFRDVDIRSGPGYSPSVMGRVDPEVAAGAFRPNAKRKFLFRAVTPDTLGTVPFDRAHGRPL